jgi:hypothetical protein
MAVAVSEVEKMAAYDAMVAKLPKRDRRNLSRASAQTKWIMEAVTRWFNFQQGGTATGLGLPSENVLHRAGLLIPRAPLRVVTPIAEVPEIVSAVNNAVGSLLESRVRVLIAWERHGQYGTEYVANKLHMSSDATTRYLKQARQSLADILRGMGWRVPQGEREDGVL